MKIRHQQADNASGISSANSNTSKAMLSCKPKKLQAGKRSSLNSSASPNTSAAHSIAASSAASSIASPTTSKGKRNRKAPDYFGFESLVCSVSDPETMPAPKRQTPSNPVIETIIQKEALLRPAFKVSFELPVVSPPDPRIRPLRNSPIE